jgi:hypothetical protein
MTSLVMVTTILRKGRTASTFHKDWMFAPPPNPGQQRKYNDSIFNWCVKYNGGNGQWVTSHTTSTHVDGFRHPRASSATFDRCSGTNPPTLLPVPALKPKVHFANGATATAPTPPSLTPPPTNSP